MKNVCITSAIRTAVGSLNKSLKNIPAHNLGSAVIKESINRSKIKREDVELFMVCCIFALCYDYGKFKR